MIKNIPDSCIHLSIFWNMLEKTLDCPVKNDLKYISGFTSQSSKCWYMVLFKCINKSKWEFVMSVDKSDIFG